MAFVGGSIVVGGRGGRGGKVCGCIRMEMSTGRVAVGASVLSLGATLLNRLLGPAEFISAQSRADLLCVASGATLLLYGIANLEVQSREEEVVQLDGDFVDEIRTPDKDGFLKWIAESIPAAIPNIRSVLIYSNGQTILRHGPMGSNPTINPGPILNDALNNFPNRTYFGKLQILPGRYEFDYLPSNTQAILIQPLITSNSPSSSAALILAADKVRPLTSVDFGWLQALTDRINANVQPL